MKKIAFFGLMLCFTMLEIFAASRQWEENNRRWEEQRRQQVAYQAQAQQTAQNHMAEQSRIMAESMRRQQEEERKRAKELNVKEYLTKSSQTPENVVKKIKSYL